ncbi:MAG: hypothetical protein R3B93_06330 [Bacteroidia bacterium]
MELTVVHATLNCTESSCPTIYKNQDGNYVIQGFKLKSQDKKGISIPEGEDAILVPADFLKEFIEKQKV